MIEAPEEEVSNVEDVQPSPAEANKQLPTSKTTDKMKLVSEVGKRRANYLTKDELWEKYSHPDMSSKRIDSKGQYWITCKRCCVEHKMLPRDPKRHEDHVRLHCKYRDPEKEVSKQTGRTMKSASLLDMPGWIKKPADKNDGESAASTVEEVTLPEAQAPKQKCLGVAVAGALGKVSLPEPLKQHFQSSCEQQGISSTVRLAQICVPRAH